MRQLLGEYIESAFDVPARVFNLNNAIAYLCIMYRYIYATNLNNYRSPDLSAVKIYTGLMVYAAH